VLVGRGVLPLAGFVAYVVISMLMRWTAIVADVVGEEVV
jgi:hypothetical protein